MHQFRMFFQGVWVVFQVAWQTAVVVMIPGGGVIIAWRNRAKIKTAFIAVRAATVQRYRSLKRSQ